MRLPLLLPLVATLALGLAACGGDGGDNKGTGDAQDPTAAQNEFPPSSDPARNIPPDQLGKINAVIAGGDWIVGRNNFVFGVTNEEDIPQANAEVTVTFYDLSEGTQNAKPVGTYTAIQSAPGVGPEIEHVHAGGEVHVHGGEDDNRVGYYVEVEFSHPGTWGALVQAKLEDGTEGASDVGFQVREQPLFPAQGEKAIASDNLTKDDVADIAEIDSGAVPNDMHDVKIKDAIEAGRPLVVVFATPAYCVSRFCGPVTEEIESLHDDFKEDVDFVHIEIWRNFEKRELNPTVKEWLVQPNGGLTEPWVYVIDKNGVIYDRWEGPVARNIIEPAVKAVAAGEVYAAQ